MNYLKIRATHGNLTIAGIPFTTLEFSHDIDSVSDLCESLIKFESPLIAWERLVRDAKCYLDAIKGKTCSKAMLNAMAESIMKSLSSFDSRTPEGEMQVEIMSYDRLMESFVDPEPLAKQHICDFMGCRHGVKLSLPWVPSIASGDIANRIARQYGVRLSSVDVVNDVWEVSKHTPLATMTLHITPDHPTLFGELPVSVLWETTKTNALRPLHDAIPVVGDVEIEIPWTANLTDIDVAGALCRKYGIDMLGEMIDSTVAIPSGCREIFFTLGAASTNDMYAGELKVRVKFTGRTTIRRRMPEATAKTNIADLLKGMDDHTITLDRDVAPSASELFSVLLDRVGHMPATMPVFMPAAWPADINIPNAKIQLYVSPDDNYYTGELWVIIERKVGRKSRVSRLFNGETFLSINMERQATVTADQIFDKLFGTSKDPRPVVNIMEESWEVSETSVSDTYTIAVSQNDEYFRGALTVNVTWI